MVQAMETCGGARVDREENSFVMGESVRDSAKLASIICAVNDVAEGCACAHCDVVTARPQSWLQQPVSWMAR